MASAFFVSSSSSFFHVTHTQNAFNAGFQRRFSCTLTYSIFMYFFAKEPTNFPVPCALFKM